MLHGVFDFSIIFIIFLIVKLIYVSSSNEYELAETQDTNAISSSANDSTNNLDLNKSKIYFDQDDFQMVQHQIELDPINENIFHYKHASDIKSSSSKYYIDCDCFIITQDSSIGSVPIFIQDFSYPMYRPRRRGRRIPFHWIFNRQKYTYPLLMEFRPFYPYPMQRMHSRIKWPFPKSSMNNVKGTKLYARKWSKHDNNNVFTSKLEDAIMLTL